MSFLASFINGLHNSIGISTPPPDKVGMAAAIWAVSILFIVGVVVIMYVYIF